MLTGGIIIAYRHHHTMFVDRINSRLCDYLDDIYSKFVRSMILVSSCSISSAAARSDMVAEQQQQQQQRQLRLHRVVGLMT